MICLRQIYVHGFAGGKPGDDLKVAPTYGSEPDLLFSRIFVPQNSEAVRPDKKRMDGPELTTFF